MRVLRKHRFYCMLPMFLISLWFVLVLRTEVKDEEQKSTIDMIPSFESIESNSTTPATIFINVLNYTIPTTTPPEPVNYLVTEKSFCQKLKNISILIYVHSDPYNFIYRTIIRNTWANMDASNTLKIRTLFFMGKTKDSVLGSKIRWESSVYHDIIQGDYLDTYHNLTRKAISALHWISMYCSQVKYVVKVDDDVFVNVYGLSRFIHKTKLKHGFNPSKIFCSVRYNAPILRRQSAKWYVSNNTLPGQTVYPPYCLGYAFVMPIGVLLQLTNAIKDVPFFWIDDVYVTGMLTQKKNVTLENIIEYTVFSPRDYESKLVHGNAIFGHISGNQALEKRQEFWYKTLEIELNII